MNIIEDFTVFPAETSIEGLTEWYSSVIDLEALNQMPIVLSEGNICPEQPYSSDVYIDQSASPCSPYESAEEHCSGPVNADQITILDYSWAVYKDVYINHHELPSQECSIPGNTDHITVLECIDPNISLYHPPLESRSVLLNSDCRVESDQSHIDQVYSYYVSEGKDPEQKTLVPDNSSEILNKELHAHAQIHSPEIYYEEDSDSESEIFLSDLKKNKEPENCEVTASNIQGKNDALKQLMSKDIQSTSRQRKTILYSGEDSSSAETIQNIRYMDSHIKCSAVEVDHEEIVEDSPTLITHKKKKYQCDQCKRIFRKLAEFRKHIKGDHTNYKPQKPKTHLICQDCGKKMTTYSKYQQHINAHGDPDLECPKCLKVYASKSSLKVHLKIHDRKFPCALCHMSFATAEPYKKHLKKHSKFVCIFDGCSFSADSEERRDEHHEGHIENDNVGNDIKINNYDYVENQLDVTEYFINANEHHINDDQLDAHGKQNTVIDSCETVTNDHKNIFHNDEGTSYDDPSKKCQNDNSEDYRKSQGDNNYNHSAKCNIEVNDSKIIEYVDDLSEDFEEDLITSVSDLTIGISEGMKNNNVDKSGSTDTEDSIEKQISVELPKVSVKKRNKKVKWADLLTEKDMSDNILLADPKTAKKKGKNWKCNKCNKSFDRLSDLKRHLIEHIIKCTLASAVSSEKGTLCIKCEFCRAASFTTIDKYKEHLREHAKLTIYKCTICDKSFSDSSNFSKHKKIHNTPYMCDLCHRKFNTEIMLNKHHEEHKKTKPLKCKHCHRYFHFPSMLNKHVKSMHSRANTSKYSCTFCTDYFMTLKEKWEHEWAVHNIRKIIADCMICGEKFRKFSDLKRHCGDVHDVDIPARKKLSNKWNNIVRVQDDI